MPASPPSNVWKQKERIPQQRASPTITDTSNVCGSGQEIPPLESSSSNDSVSAFDGELAASEEKSAANNGNDDDFNQAEGGSELNTKIYFVTPSLIDGQNIYSQQPRDAGTPHYISNASLHNHTQLSATTGTQPPTPRIYTTTTTLHNTDKYLFEVITSDIFLNSRLLPLTYRLTHRNSLML